MTSGEAQLVDGEFRSSLLESVLAGRGSPRKAPSGLWTQWLDGAQRRGEFRAIERDWVGVDAWLGRQSGEITRDDLSSFVNANVVRAQVVTKGTLAPFDIPLPRGHTLTQDADELWRLRDDMGTVEAIGLTARDAARGGGLVSGAGGTKTRYSSYVLEGGEHYREVLVMLPSLDGGSELTLSDRVKARYADEWKDVQKWRQASFGTPAYPAALAAEQELYRRWRQEFEASGETAVEYRSPHFDEANVLLHLRTNVRMDARGVRTLFIEEVQSDWHQAGRAVGYRSRGSASVADADAGDVRVPDAPLKATQDWIALGFKQALKEAVRAGCEQIAWTPGSVQTARYDMSAQVRSISWMKRHDGRFDLEADLVGRNEPSVRKGLTPEAMAAMVGKELATKIVDGVGAFPDDRCPYLRGVLEQADIALGGEGMRAFYDTIMPAVVGRFVKPFGGAVGATTLPGGLGVKCVRVTDAMREGVAEGLTLFRRVPDCSAVVLPMDEVLSVVHEFIEGYHGGLSPLSIRVGRTFDDMYAAGRYQPDGAVVDLAADRMTDAACVEATLRHEILGHYGLATLRPDDKRALLDAVSASRFEPSLRQIWAQVDRRYADQPEHVRAEEVFAIIAERPRCAPARLWDHLMAILNRGLRAAGLATGETSKAELHVLVQAIARSLRERRPGDGLVAGEPRVPGAKSLRFMLAPSAEERLSVLRTAGRDEAGDAVVAPSP